jgi:hypothetical protein
MQLSEPGRLVAIDSEAIHCAMQIIVPDLYLTANSVAHGHLLDRIEIAA